MLMFFTMYWNHKGIKFSAGTNRYDLEFADRVYFVLSDNTVLSVRELDENNVEWTMTNKENKLLDSGECVFEGDETFDRLLDLFLDRLVDDWCETRR